MSNWAHTHTLQILHRRHTGVWMNGAHTFLSCSFWPETCHTEAIRVKPPTPREVQLHAGRACPLSPHGPLLGCPRRGFLMPPHPRHPARLTLLPGLQILFTVPSKNANLRSGACWLSHPARQGPRRCLSSECVHPQTDAFRAAVIVSLHPRMFLFEVDLSNLAFASPGST